MNPDKVFTILGLLIALAAIYTALAWIGLSMGSTP